MDNLLALDTSTENCSCALLSAGQIYAVEQLAPQLHAELLLSMADEVLRQSGLSKGELQGLVLGVGPGSFTGVRIAAAAAQGLALGLNLPVCRVSSLEALAYQALEQSSDGVGIASIDARMNEVYLSVYRKQEDSLTQLLTERVLPPAEAVSLLDSLTELKDYAVLCGGSGIDLLYNAGLNKNFKKNSLFPTAQAIVKLGRNKFDSHLYVDAAEALPLYVRNEVAWKKIDQQVKTKP
ncbi:MAG: tRNA (adenosine(37)-N6)-threonylcarbamoyltransferase complex dimerization subunit type 1 TsaB [Succinivibrio sp.]|nr:tRNA (adenosine(37)-N6)-threonylcarbamoyltransferase complex dimerization subunit type 1 TsaB [Succinivibrio sp.]